jgi:hypothetical protein
MVPTRDPPRDTQGTSADLEDDLGHLIRWSLEASVSAAEPPADVWPKILSRVRAMDAPKAANRGKKPARFPLAPLLQAVVISVLLLVLGVEMNRNVVTPERSRRTPTAPTNRHTPASQGYPDDILRGCILARQAREAPVRRTGPIPEA